MKYTFDYNFRPRHADFDEYGIAHHSRFFCWFEEARYECFEQYGELFKDICSKYKFPLSSSNAKYMHPVTDTRELCVRVIIDLPLEVPILKIGYRLMDKKDGRLIAKAETSHCFTDSNLVMQTRVPDEFNKIVETLMEKQNEEKRVG